MNVNKAIMQRVCDFICEYYFSEGWICKKFYKYLYNKDCDGDCDKCGFFDPGEMMEWMKENHIWK